MRKSIASQWGARCVLVGALRDKKQLDVALSRNFYHIPAERLRDAEKIRFVAIYQSRNFYGKDAGIWWYGRVGQCRVVPRFAIAEIPKQSSALYCRFDIQQWTPMRKPIVPKGPGFVSFLTTEYQLLHSRELPELTLDTPAQFALYGKLRSLGARWLFGTFRWGPVRVTRFRSSVTLKAPNRTPIRLDLHTLRENTTDILTQILRLQ